MEKPKHAREDFEKHSYTHVKMVPERQPVPNMMRTF